MNNLLEMVNLSEKIAIVTGGTMGIGEGCAKALLGAGANVVICARREDYGKTKADELNEIYGAGKCEFVKCDVKKEEDIKHVIDYTVQKFGGLNVLVNNAGYHPNEEFIDDVTGEMFEDLLKLNLVSIFLFCKFALPHLRKVKGSIVNMSSLVGSMGQKQACRYVSTKGGILGLTKALAVDEGPNGVRVNSISPGSIASPLTMEYLDAMANSEYEYQKICDCSHLGRIGTIDETGMACLFLASDMSSFITGVDIPVSGGAELAYGKKTY